MIRTLIIEDEAKNRKRLINMIDEHFPGISIVGEAVSVKSGLEKISQLNPELVLLDIRLEDGDIVHEEIEKLAKKESINAAALIIIGGADSGSKLIVGPEEGRAEPVVPMEHAIPAAHNIWSTGIDSIHFSP